MKQQTEITAEQLKAATNATIAIAEAIRELKEVPAGKLYAMVCGVMDLGQFEAMLQVLLNAGVVKRSAMSRDLLQWAM